MTTRRRAARLWSELFTRPAEYALGARRPVPPAPFVDPAFFTQLPPQEEPMYEITKDFSFSASHQLAGLPDDHPCARLHGHPFLVRLHLAAERLNEVGFVVDYRDLAGFSDWLDSEYDHRHLNDRVGFNPTAENMCCHLLNVARNEFDLPVVAVSWSETPKTWATYRVEEAA